jgi:two-component system, LytTR family, sensor histidine kinase AlgZ
MHSRLTRLCKRMFDLAAVVAAVPFWLPALAVVGLAVWVVDGRPIFFRQWRAGRHGRPFRIWKYRTMTAEADEGRRRPTRLGRWLRLRGLDELPQILNVITGQMSLVGPRPLSLADVQRLSAAYPPFARRFAVAPGITGLAQICQAKGAELTTRLDIEYARACSAPLDVLVLLRTVWINVVGKKRGAAAIFTLLPKTDATGDDPARVARETLRGLLSPRRSVAIALVFIPMLVAQAHWSKPAGALPLGIAFCLAFVVVAPVSWRLLLPDGVLGRGAWLRLLMYAAIGTGTIMSLGVAIPKVLGIGVTFLTAGLSLAISLALFLVGGWGLARDIDFEHRLQREQARADALAREAERAQLLALRAQLDPHFLFNTLNSIAEWCREDGKVAEQAVLQLSAMLRSVLVGVKAAAWPLSQELELLDTLFALHRLRDPELFELARVVDPDTGTVPVPPLILLPLAENAIKHGPGAGHRGEIALSLRRDGEQVVFTLENPGAYRGPRQGSMGLPSLERRLALAYFGAAALHLEGRGERTRIELRLPAAGPRLGVIV